MLGLFLVGLAFSITLSESVLAVLVVLWLLGLRDKAARVRESFPLAWPVGAFVAATLLSALRSASPVASLVDSKSLLLLLVLYVLVRALRDVETADWFLTGLFLLLAVHAGLGIIQVTLCPPEKPLGVPWFGRFFHRCDRAHGFFSIYMTLAGVLSLIPALAVLGIIAALYAVYIFYLGLPVMMGTPADKVVPYMAVSALVIIVLSVILSVFAAAITGLGGYGLL